MPARKIIAAVENDTGGKVIEISAFTVDGAVTFRILCQQQDGIISAKVVDGITGTELHDQALLGHGIPAFTHRIKRHVGPVSDTRQKIILN